MNNLGIEFPSAVIQAWLEEPENLLETTATSEEITSPAPIYEGRNPGNADSSATLIFDQDITNPVFYWQSSDSVLGEINATIETTPGIGSIWNYNPINDCLVFRGTADGAIIFGKMVGNQGTAYVMRDGRFISYVFEASSSYNFLKGKGDSLISVGVCVECEVDNTEGQSSRIRLR
ncbi:MAG: hypothetical protein QNJ64_20830 [Crocosphaera sp.]|nr:hypothetical protein [Crocosphaera sp.]